MKRYMNVVLLTCLLPISASAQTRDSENEFVDRDDVNAIVDTRESIFYYYDDESLRQTGHFLNGERDSVWRAWHQNGQLWATATFQEGDKTGIWTVYDQFGNLKYELVFIENKLHEAREWNTEGDLVATR